MGLRLPAHMLILSAVLAAFVPRTAVCGERSVLLMWWNVENLFDTRDDPKTNDDEFTPSGKKRWTEKKLRLKCMRLSHVVKAVALKHGGYPDILAFAEVENRDVFRRMLSFLPGHAYKTAYHDSPDRRGIDIAVAYDSTRITLLGSASRNVTFDGRPSRDISLYRFSSGASDFHLLVNHWPSRSLDRSWSEPARILAAKIARNILDSLRTETRQPDIVVMGDFNDEPHDRSVGEVLGAESDRESFLDESSNGLYNCWGDSQEKGTYVYRGKWQKLDQIMVSRGLFDRKGFFLPDAAFSCFRLPHMSRGKRGGPWATYRGPVFLGGYSDHFPLLLRIATVPDSAFGGGEKDATGP